MTEGMRAKSGGMTEPAGATAPSSSLIPYPSSLGLRTQVLLWGAQRASAAVLALCVLVHLATIIYAVRGGLSAAEILARTSGSMGWSIFYGVFVAAVAVHAPIGLRNVLAETFGWRGRGLDVCVLLVGIVLALWGWRAVYAVVGSRIA
jgi:fumarate reductase subunit C